MATDTSRERLGAHRRKVRTKPAAWFLFVGVAISLAGCATNRFGAPREALSPDHVAVQAVAKPQAKPCAELGPTYESHFTGEGAERAKGKLYLVLLDDKAEPSIRGGRSLWALTKTLTYTPSNGADSITVPKGFVTDLASIPRWAWELLPPDGPWAKAAVIHDYLYYTEGTGVWDRHPTTITRATPYTRAEANWILRDAMKDRCVGVVDRNIIYAAVRVGGSEGWGH
jgi:hypothetical protein